MANRSTVGQWMSELGKHYCWICGWSNGTVFDPENIRHLEVHHIERRSHAPKNCDTMLNFFLSCSICHATKLDTMPHAKQLAYKKKHDPKNYSLKWWLRVRDPDLKAPERVTEEDVRNGELEIEG